MNDHLEPHELALLFPPLGPGGAQELAANIKLNGLQNPIVLYEGKILDGVQRNRACRIACVPPVYVNFADLPEAQRGNGPLAFVVSQNLHRRHLTSGTYRQLHRKLLPLVEQELKERVEETKANGVRCQVSPNPKGGRPVATGKKEAVKRVAKMTGSSERTVYRNVSKGPTPSERESAYRQGAQNANVEITRDMLSMSAQEKTDRYLRRKVEELARSFSATVTQEVHRQVNNRLEGIAQKWHEERDHCQAIMKKRWGFMTARTYKLILSCLHPDWVTDEKQKARYASAFTEFIKLEKYLMDEKESPTVLMPLPRTRAEWDALKKKAKEDRKRSRSKSSLSVT
jgi:hypothetical protein